VSSYVLQLLENDVVLCLECREPLEKMIFGCFGGSLEPRSFSRYKVHGLLSPKVHEPDNPIYLILVDAQGIISM
jgi:hypothetical protein